MHKPTLFQKTLFNPLVGSVSEVGQQGVQEVTGSTSTVSTTTTQWTWTPADNNNNDYDSGTVYRLDSKLSATLQLYVIGAFDFFLAEAISSIIANPEMTKETLQMGKTFAV